MRILFIITSWDFGGAEIQVMQLAYKMKKLGNNILILSMIEPNKKFLLKSNNLNLEVRSLLMKKGFPDPSAIYRLRKIIQEFQPNVVHAHMIHAIILSRITRLLINIPKLISTAHSINEGGGFRNLMYRFTDFLSDINTNVSKLGTNEYITNKLFSKKKSIFIPNGITLTKKKNYLLNGNLNTNLKKEFNIPINHSIALAVGRFAKAKDYSNLINAIDKIVNRNKNFTLLIAGDGKLRKKIELQIQVLKLGNHIKLLGVRNDILYLMQNVDVFVMSSAWEGLPIVILEAASVGLPAVVTNVGGNKEVIENDKNGFIVPPKDSDELSKAIKKMIELPKTRRIEMGKYSRLKVKNIYEINKIVEKWLKIYNS